MCTRRAPDGPACCGCGPARLGPLHTRAPVAAEHRHVHVRPQVRAALRICRGAEASHTGVGVVIRVRTSLTFGTCESR